MMILKIIGIAAAISAGLFVLFVLAPSLIAFVYSFGHRRDIPYEERYARSPHFLCIRQQNDAAHNRLLQLPQEHVSVIQSRKGRKPLRLCGVLYGEPSDKVAVLMHGYREDPLFSVGIYGSFLHQKGFRVLIPDERACGQSEGRFVTMGAGEGKDAVLWTDYAAGLPGVTQVLLAGKSLGGAAVLFASDRVRTPKLRAIVSDCPFITPVDQMREVCRKNRYPSHILVPMSILLGKILTGENFGERNTDHLKNGSCPVFLITGDADALVPAENSRTLYGLAPAGSGLFVTPGAGHAVAFPLGGDAAREALSAFLEKQYDGLNDRNNHN